MYRNKNFISLIFILLFGSLPFSVHAQDSTHTKEIKPTLNGAYLKSYYKDTRDVIISPFKWKKTEWITFVGVTGLAGVCYVYDQEIQNLFQRNRTNDLNNIAQFGLEPWGNYYTASAVGLLGIYGYIAKDNKAKYTAYTALKAAILTTGATYIIKYALHRHRPFEEQNNPYVFDGPSLEEGHDSFISGHSSFVFSVATVIGTAYKDELWVPITAYTIAGLTGISRIYQNKHWASDVIVGAAFGYAIGKLCYQKNNWGLSVFPFKNAKVNGLAVIIPIK